MKNQFFYTRREPIQDTDPVEFKEFTDSLNITKIIRSVRMEVKCFRQKFTYKVKTLKDLNQLLNLNKMSKGYKKLLGNRIYVNVPKKEESKIIVDENTKEALQKEMLKKMSRLTVYDVGDSVSMVKPGDIVLINPAKLTDALLIPLSEDKDVLLISPFDIIHVW